MATIFFMVLLVLHFYDSLLLTNKRFTES